ncbi:MAG: hypothetical protein ACLSE6_06145 [Alphaproteobacteria bacterium]
MTKHQFLVPMLSPYIGAAAASMFTDVYWILVAGAGILTFVVLMISSNQVWFILSGLFCRFGGLVADSYIMRQTSEFAVKCRQSSGQDCAECHEICLFLFAERDLLRDTGRLKRSAGVNGRKETQGG